MRRRIGVLKPLPSDPGGACPSKLNPPRCRRVCHRSAARRSRRALMRPACRPMADCWRCVRSSSGLPSPLAWRAASVIRAIPAGRSQPRDPSRAIHGLDEIIRTRMLMIAAGCEDGNDADRLRRDPMFKLAMGRLPDDADVCSQPTLSRLENLPDARALPRMGRAGRARLPELPPGATAHRARRRRHVRRRARRPAVASVQRPSRRIRLPADRGVRRRRPHDRRRAAPGQPTVGATDRALAPPADHRDPGPLAAGGDHAARRQP